MCDSVTGQAELSGRHPRSVRGARHGVQGEDQEIDARAGLCGQPWHPLRA